MKNPKIKLAVELIPSTCHFSNVRTTVKASEWDKIRFLSYEAADNKCQICGDTGKNQGYKHNVECHEIWHYDDENHVQTLIGLISLCPTCHQVKHIGRAFAIGKQNQAIAQLIKVNKWTPIQTAKHIEDAFILHKERSKYKWSLDLSLLNQEPYNLNIDITKNRIFEIKKYKKKRKKVKKTTIGNKPKSKPIAKKTAVKRPPKKS